MKKQLFFQVFRTINIVSKNDIKYHNTYRKHDIFVYWSEEDNTLLASCPVLGIDVPEDNKYNGDIDSLIDELKDCMDGLIELVKEENKGVMKSLYLGKQVKV